MSVKPVALKAPFSYKKYYILTYFSLPQLFDSEGQLLDKKSLTAYAGSMVRFSAALTTRFVIPFHPITADGSGSSAKKHFEGK